MQNSEEKFAPARGRTDLSFLCLEGVLFVDLALAVVVRVHQAVLRVEGTQGVARLAEGAEEEPVGLGLAPSLARFLQLTGACSQLGPPLLNRCII